MPPPLQAEAVAGHDLRDQGPQRQAHRALHLQMLPDRGADRDVPVMEQPQPGLARCRLRTIRILQTGIPFSKVL